PLDLGFGLAMAALLAVLATLPYLPFQDIPNHTQLLTLARLIPPGQTTAFYERAGPAALGYSLYVWVDRFVLHGLAPDTSLRLIVLAAAAFMPLSIGRLAARLDASPAVARLFALPLALSWPMREGLVPYVLALPAAVLALAEGARLAEDLSGAARA